MEATTAARHAKIPYNAELIGGASGSLDRFNMIANNPQYYSERFPTIVKIVAGILLIVACLIWLVPRAKELVQPGAAPESGARGLIILDTSTGVPGLRINVRQHFTTDGVVEFLWFLSRENLDYDKNAHVDFMFYYVGEPHGEIVCGDGTVAQKVGFTSATAEVQSAIKNDIGSSLNSAIALEPDEDRSTEEIEAIAREQQIHVYGGKMLPYNEGDGRWSQRTVNGNSIFSEMCTLKAESAWRMPPDESYESAARRNLLPYQVNWTGDSRREFRAAMNSYVEIERQSGISMTNSYPEAITRTEDWTYKQVSNWSGREQAEHAFIYTNQPVYLFEATDRSDRQAYVALWAGVILGILATVIIGIGSKVVDLWFWDQRRQTD